ncbi:hypothetical protein GOODEAATRI_009084 [Goodea atripinnis]|uniref:Rho-GAP domain-containing protein n=1 Tax=Goodea atripinnis TaxID=208336 RepID=A0ABV0N1Z9_9TELE
MRRLQMALCLRQRGIGADQEVMLILCRWIFGQKLEETVRYERRFGNKLAPMLVEQCVDFIRQWGLQEEGLFRLPGQANLVKELQDAFDCGEKPSFDCNTDVHTVASLLKLYLRELPEPVIPFQKYEEFLASAKLLGKDDEMLMAVLIGRHDVLFPRDKDKPTALELANNNIEPLKGQVATTTSAVTALSQNAENNNTQLLRQCVWEAAESQSHRQQEDNRGSPRSSSPRNVIAGQFEMTRSPPLMVKKNPAFSKGSGIVTNGSFSSSPPSDFDKTQNLTVGGSFPMRRSGAFKGPGTKMGTSGVTSGGSPAANGTGALRLGISSSDAITGSPNSRNGLWVQNGCVALRENSKTRDSSNNGDQMTNQNRLSTYDNVQLNHQNLQNQITSMCLNTSCEDKQSVDSATWSTSSCEISLPDNSTSCRSSTTTCPEQDFYSGHLEQRNLELETEMVGLHEELDQERKKYTMVEIKLRNAERAKEDAERRNQMLQKEMEQFFSTFSDLTATGNSAPSEPRRPDRNNAIWIQ